MPGLSLQASASASETKVGNESFLYVLIMEANHSPVSRPFAGDAVPVEPRQGGVAGLDELMAWFEFQRPHGRFLTPKPGPLSAIFARRQLFCRRCFSRCKRVGFVWQERLFTFSPTRADGTAEDAEYAESLRREARRERWGRTEDQASAGGRQWRPEHRGQRSNGAFPETSDDAVIGGREGYHGPAGDHGFVGKSIFRVGPYLSHPLL